ncbi:hypothetical protein GUITHDRAFT_135281 [Guillardia theta CCMP2712]|uniref:Nonsense-mediated mRNA decay factor SMG8 n=1 Tax=Guillardia theta (strain CCMP2712) TaxID=905079 RepID=L1JR47_GUITC|nr:hypothetical protein GUITHDRAFT_135281 [Guillardia theta CCMP2712]EKX50665.1 hypothetical protein GUITHDRAFT_135281 [Guillardia theta CCMP2712]|eukprot:XP_005837645.1 hypothetical protein GUITHDRAFT_135281 [Guillardia theta CCMP2712]
MLQTSMNTTGKLSHLVGVQPFMPDTDQVGEKKEENDEDEKKILKVNPKGLLPGKYHVVGLVNIEGSERPAFLDECTAIDLEENAVPPIPVFIPEDDEAYFASEQQEHAWRSCLLTIFLSAQCVFFCLEGPRFPPHLLSILRSLQSAKAVMIKRFMVEAEEQLPGNRQNTARRKKSVNPKISSNLLRLEKALDAQIRQLLISSGCLLRPSYKALFALSADKCLHILEDENVLLESNKKRMEDILDMYMQISEEVADGSSNQKNDGWGDDLPSSFSFSSFLSAHLDSSIPILSFSTHPPPKLRVTPVDGEIWRSNYARKARKALASTTSSTGGGEEQGADKLEEERGNVMIEDVSMELAGGLWADQEVSVRCCREAARKGLSEYLRGAPKLYRKEEHERRKKRAIAVFSSLSRGPARREHLSCLLSLCDLQWKEEKRQCERVSFNFLPCLHAAASCLQEDGCRSGLTFSSFSGCGRRRKEREDPFTFLASNHRFYEQCEKEMAEVGREFLCLPLKCRRSEERKMEEGEEGGDASERRRRTAELRKVRMKDGRPLLCCRLYVLGPREAYKEEEGFQPEGCESPCFFQKIAQKAEETRDGEILASSNSQEEGRGDGNGRSAGKGTGKKSASGGGGGGGGGGMEDTDWPSLPLLANIRNSRWSDRSRRFAGSEKEEGASDKGGEKQGNSRRKRTTNALEDALSSALEKKAQSSHQKQDCPHHKDDCLVALDYEAKHSRSLSTDLSVEV